MSDLPKFHSFYAAIQFHARLNPHAPAIVSESQSLTYAEFCVQIERVTRRLAKAGLPAGARATVQVGDGLLRWLALIALARMGVLSGSAISDTELRLLEAAVLITDRPANWQGGRIIEIGNDWLDAGADSLPPFIDRPHDADAPCRIVLSSGTTGTPKKALFTYGQIRVRNRGTARMYGLNATARQMVTVGTGTVAGYVMPITCWSGGGAVLLPSFTPERPMSDLLRLNPNILFMSPAQLATLVDSLPAQFWPWQHLSVYVAGSELPPVVSRRARLRLTQSLFMLYGSTEAGIATLAHASSADGRPGFSGYVVPTAEIEIVDEQGQPVPDGSVGEVRIRADGMVDRYLDDAETTNEIFRDGWFYPGDAGTISEDRALILLGRTRELMNLNGVKISPAVVDQALAEIPGVKDLAVFALTGPAGTQPAVAVVAGDDFEMKRLGQRYREHFPKLPPLVLARVASIPRNEMGKVMRAQLAASVREAMKAQASAGPAANLTEPPG